MESWNQESNALLNLLFSFSLIHRVNLVLKYSFLTNLHRKGSKWEQQAKKKGDLRLSSRFSRAPATLDIHVLIGWILAAFRHLDTGNGAEKSKQEKQRSTIWKHGTSKVHSRLTNCNSSTSRDLCAKGHVRRWKKLKVLVLGSTFFEQVIGRQCFTELSDVLAQVYATNIQQNYFLENDIPVLFHILDMDLSIQASIDVAA